MPDFHAQFIAAMHGQEERLEPFLKDPTHMARARVYRNNSVTATADAIFKTYSTLERLVGVDFLRATAIEFVKSHPPQNPVMALYGDAFPDFLSQFAPVASLPYLSDVARLDWAWIEAMFSENALALSPQDLAGLDETEVSALAPGLHPSVRILDSEWPAWEIWRANREEDEPIQMSIEPGWSSAVVWWSVDGAVNWQLDRGEAIFLRAIAAGSSFGEAIEKGSYKSDPTELFGFFSKALAAGIFANPAESSNRKAS